MHTHYYIYTFTFTRMFRRLSQAIAAFISMIAA